MASGALSQATLLVWLGGGAIGALAPQRPADVRDIAGRGVPSAASLPGAPPVPEAPAGKGRISPPRFPGP